MLNLYRAVFIFITISICTATNAQLLIQLNSIPDSLTTDANAVILYHAKEFSVIDKENANLKERMIVTILNENGEKYGIFREYYDSFRSLEVKKAIIYDKNGQIIKKIKKKEIKDYSIMSGYSLFTDYRQKYIKPVVNKYPYSVEYEFEIKYKGILNYPSWYPVIDYNVSVLYASFTIESEQPKGYRYIENMVNTDYHISKREYGNSIEWELKNCPPVIEEPLSDHFEIITPYVQFAPNEFSIGGYPGNMANWNDFGKWIYQLISAEDHLSETQIMNIENLVKDEADTYKKIEKIYNYVQNTTRYVSIQLGIGGWQPFKASVVEELGYGDCKALTNYTRTLLSAAGIPSYYTLVKSGYTESPVNIDFSSNQFNHVILCVPYKKDTLWLECTNQRIPFGFLGSFTDNRHVLLIKETGGEIAHTLKYSQDDNKQTNNARVQLNENGDIDCKMYTNMSGKRYDNLRYLLYERTEEQKNILYREIGIENIHIHDFSVNEKRERIPNLSIYTDIYAKNYASTAGNRIFLPLNLNNRWKYVPEEMENRKNEVILRKNYSDYDTVVYNLPEHITIEYLPDSVEFETPFGLYKSFVEKNSNTITYIRILKLNSGRFKPAMHRELRAFYKHIKQADNANAVLQVIN